MDVVDLLTDVKAVLFDLDNTLIDTKGADRIACDKVCRYLEDRGIKTSTAEDCVQRFYDFVRSSPQDPVEGRTDVDSWRTRLWSKSLGTKLSSHSERAYHLWKTERMKHLGLSRAVTNMLCRLRESNFKLGVITNGPSDAQREKLRRIDAQRYFDVFLISGDYPAPTAKPHPFLFELAFEYMSVKASQTIMVGDKLETDVEGGANAGCQATFLVASPKDCTLWDDVEVKPDFVVKHVCDIMDYLPTLATEAAAKPASTSCSPTEGKPFFDSRNSKMGSRKTSYSD